MPDGNDVTGAGAPKLKNAAEITLDIYQQLSAIDASERRKVIQAVMTLLGDTVPVAVVPAEAARPATAPKALILGPQSSTDAADFFGRKEPQSKVEELAVAARFREIVLGEDVHTKDDLRQVVRSARRNFDDGNFRRDIGNAKTGGLFNKGKELTLSYFGQNYVDVLPDRASLKSLKRPKGAKSKTARNRKGTKSGDGQ